MSKLWPEDLFIERRKEAPLTGESIEIAGYWRREINSSFFDQLHDRHAGKSFRTGVNCKDALEKMELLATVTSLIAGQGKTKPK